MFEGHTIASIPEPCFTVTVTQPAIQLRLLGDLQLWHGEQVAALPPSKKTRALLAFLALTGKPQRRARLCDMFWDVADDPRAGLRWSLSKLRPLVNSEDCTRLSADRESVVLETEQLTVDVLQIRHALQSGLQSLSTERLEELAQLFRGELLRGLELLEFHDFQAWCVAQREDARRMHMQVLTELVQRLEETPERALPHAEAWVGADPLGVAARTAVVRLLVALGRTAQAEEHVRASQRLFKDLGDLFPGEIREALTTSSSHSSTAAPSARLPTLAGAPAPERIEPPPSQSTARLPHLVGREVQVGQLHSVLAEVTQGRTQRAVLFTGEPGLGKTRLLAELKALAYQQGVPVLEGRCFEAELGRPYGLFLDALRRWLRLGLSEPDRTDLSQLIAELSDAQLAQGTRDTLFASVASFIKRQAQSAQDCLCFVLDDLQWCDPASSALLHFVARMTRDCPVLLALAARDGELVDNTEAHRLIRSLAREGVLVSCPLPRLDERAVEQLLAGLSPSTDRRQILAQSGGNPLYVVELARSELGDSAGLGLELRELVNQRVERLPHEAADALRWASVLGSVFTVEHLESLSSLSFDDLAHALLLLERHALLIAETEGYTFSHDLVRHVVYSELSPPRRRLMHRKVAEQLQSAAAKDSSLAGEVARHAALAGQYALATQACVAAGRRCARLFANRQALSLASAGLHYAQELAEEEQVVFAIELREVQFSVEQPRDMPGFAKELERLSRRALDFGRSEHARLGFHLLSYSRWEQGDWDEAKKKILAAEQLSRSGEPSDRVQAISEASRCLVLLERDLPNAEALAMEATTLAERLGLDPAPLADALGMLAQHRGEYELAGSYYDKAFQQAQFEGRHLIGYHALARRAALAIQLEHYTLALELAEQLTPLAERFRGGSEAPIARAISAFAKMALQSPRSGGSTEPASSAVELIAAELSAAIEAVAVVDAKYWLILLLLWRGRFMLAHGDTQQAQQDAKEALRLGQILERASEKLLAHCLLGELAHRAGDARALETHQRHGGECLHYASAYARSRYEALSTIALKISSAGS